MGFYRFIRNVGSALAGVGVSDAAYQRSQSIPLESVVGTGIFVQRQPGSMAPGFALTAQGMVPTVDLRGNGVDLHGQLVLTTLADNGGK